MMKQNRKNIPPTRRYSVFAVSLVAFFVAVTNFVACGKADRPSATGASDLEANETPAIVNSDEASIAPSNTDDTGHVYTGYSGSDLSQRLDAVRGTQYQPQAYVQKIDKVSAATVLIEDPESAVSAPAGGTEVSSAFPVHPFRKKTKRVVDVAISSNDGQTVHYQRSGSSATSDSAELNPVGNVPVELLNTKVRTRCLDEDCSGTENEIINQSGAVIAAFSTDAEERDGVIWQEGHRDQAQPVQATVQSSEVVDGKSQFSLALHDNKIAPNLVLNGGLVETSGDCVPLTSSGSDKNIKACLIGNTGDGKDLPLALYIPDSSSQPMPAPASPTASPQNPRKVVKKQISPRAVPSDPQAAASEGGGAGSSNAKGKAYFISWNPRKEKPNLNHTPDPAQSAPTNAAPILPLVSSSAPSSADQTPMHVALGGRGNKYEVLDDSELPIVCRKPSRDQVKDVLVSQILEGCRRKIVRDQMVATTKVENGYWRLGGGLDIRGILQMMLNEDHYVFRHVTEKLDLSGFNKTIQVLKNERMHPILMGIAMDESKFVNLPIGGTERPSGRWQITPNLAKEIGLSISPVDLRRDAAASAKAVARYMRSLMQRQGREGRYEFSLATYNCGDFCMDKKVARYASDANVDYWGMLYRGMFKGNAASGYTARIFSASVMWIAPQELNLTSVSSGKSIPPLDISTPITDLK